MGTDPPSFHLFLCDNPGSSHCHLSPRLVPAPAIGSLSPPLNPRVCSPPSSKDSLIKHKSVVPHHSKKRPTQVLSPQGYLGQHPATCHLCDITCHSLSLPAPHGPTCWPVITKALFDLCIFCFLCHILQPCTLVLPLIACFLFIRAQITPWKYLFNWLLSSSLTGVEALCSLPYP